MSQPTPEPIDAEQLPELAAAVIRDAKFPMLATADGDQPRLRPVSPVRTDGFTIYVANLSRYSKTAEIAANPKVELCYLAPNHDQVRITGTVEILDDPVLLEDIWHTNTLLREYLQSPDNPELIIYRVRPSRVRFMREWALKYHDVPL